MENYLHKQDALPAMRSHEDRMAIAEALQKELSALTEKIVVLDDDPTGVQTVHDVSVYTDWSRESIESGFQEENSMFFILTNSRSLTQEETAALHRKLGTEIAAAAKRLGKKFLLVSRSDSTLRGHYPLETEVLRQSIESTLGQSIDGEIMIPFFPEGGRYTLDDIHYVAQGDILIPAGQTEFAQDKTFGYHSSDLKDWIAEKTEGKYPSDSVRSVTLPMLRSMDYDTITNLLLQTTSFSKVIVNAADYDDVSVFTTALVRAIHMGKHFLFRTAAAFPKILGGVASRPLLQRDELVPHDCSSGGIVIAGSHVKKTTAQLAALKDAGLAEFIEFNQHLVLDEEAFLAEQRRVVALVENLISSGRSVVVQTRRQRFDVNTGNKEDELRVATRISDGLTGIVSALKTRPSFIIAKGGITSSDVGTRGLGVKRAIVMGQILPGIPVWQTGNESKFPGLPYVIFPGNVGDDDALLQAVRKLI